MKIRLGTTRIVFLVGNKAVKVARIRPIRFLFRAISFPFTSKNNHQRFYKKYGQTFLSSVVRYIFFGFYANSLEYKFYKNHKDDKRIVPTVKKFAWGFIAIQVGGLDVSLETFEHSNPFKNTPNQRYQEVYHPKQFCEINHKILLADYGHIETCKLLIKTASKFAVHSSPED